jgi:hypothetical protein
MVNSYEVKYKIITVSDLWDSMNETQKEEACRHYWSFSTNARGEIGQCLKCKAIKEFKEIVGVLLENNSNWATKQAGIWGIRDPEKAASEAIKLTLDEIGNVGWQKTQNLESQLFIMLHNNLVDLARKTIPLNTMRGGNIDVSSSRVFSTKF